MRIEARYYQYRHNQERSLPLSRLSWRFGTNEAGVMAKEEKKTSVQRFLNQPTRRGRVLILARAGAGGTDTVDRALSCA